VAQDFVKGRFNPPIANPAVGSQRGAVYCVLRDNGLSIAFFGLFLIFLAGQAAAGYFAFNQQQEDHGRDRIGFASYLVVGHFLEGVFENWESEFLQMGANVLLTTFLFQKGSAVSKKPPEGREQETAKASDTGDGGTNRPARRRGITRWLYEHSLATAFAVLFLLSFFLHGVFGAEQYNQEQRAHGKSPVSRVQFMATAEFWYQSFQNYQSEFLALGSMAVLSIYLRQKGSAQSKPVDAPNDQTGTG
jgi:hypothetical protein